MKGDNERLTEQEPESSANEKSNIEYSRVYWGNGVAMVCSAEERSDLTNEPSLNPSQNCFCSEAGCAGCDTSQDLEWTASGWSRGQGDRTAGKTAGLSTLCPARWHPLPGNHRDPPRSPGKGAKLAMSHFFALFRWENENFLQKSKYKYQPIPTYNLTQATNAIINRDVKKSLCQLLKLSHEL